MVEYWLYFILRFIPFYLLFKLAFVIWLQLPQTQVRSDPYSVMFQASGTSVVLRCLRVSER